MSGYGVRPGDVILGWRVSKVFRPEIPVRPAVTVLFDNEFCVTVNLDAVPADRVLEAVERNVKRQQVDPAS